MVSLAIRRVVSGMVSLAIRGSGKLGDEVGGYCAGE